MSINNNFSVERIKKALDIKTVLAALLIVSALAVCFYITIENLESNEVLIWLVTDDAETNFSDETLKLINDYGSGKGIDRILLTKRHPDDQYFDALMSTSAFYTCDIFIMEKDLVEKYADSDIFLPLSNDGTDAESMLYVGDAAVGFLLCEDYYFLINSRTDVDREIIYDIYDYLDRNSMITS